MGTEPISNRLAPPPCNGVPPANLKRPFVRRLTVDRAKWSRAIRGAIPDVTHLAVALTLSNYGDSDGSNNHPGGERLASDVCKSVRTIRNSLAWLDEHGFITRTSVGNRTAPRGWADVYRLSVPAPLAESLGMWTEERNGPIWMERPKRDEDGYPFPERGALTTCNGLHVVA